ncbi:MAG: SRPBCC family protein [Ilumatobacteraceae bacterium]
MIEVTRSRTVAAPIGDIWNVLAEFDTISRWAPNVDHSCLLADRPDDDGLAGDMLGIARRVQSGRFVLVERITTWEPQTRLAYEITGLPPVLRHVVNEWRLTAPDTPSSTHVALVTQVDCGPRPPQQLIARAAGRSLARASDKMLAGLADWCTTTKGTTP